MKIKIFFYLLFFSFIISNCVGVKTTGASGSIKKYIEEFYIGNGINQYFIKPLQYTSVNKENATLDATIRNINKETDSVTINFTVSLKTLNNISKVILKNPEGETSIKTVKTLYKEKQEDFYTHRGSIKTLYKTYLNYLLNKDHKILISNGTNNISIFPSKKSIKKIEILRQKLPNKILN